ncbi:MAG: hypothetical protein IJ830_05105 [Alphaproteobacteria bacterium]|nr:hypothetical protein [Alphaproteobacteria bacterium]
MFKKILASMLIASVLCACASKTPELSGVDGSDIPQSFANFPDIPFPKKAYLDLEDTKALGSGENWIGSVTYTAPYNASRLFDFYVSEMPKLRWVEIAVVRTKISHMTYFRDNRALQILIESRGTNDSKVTITAIPNQAAAMADKTYKGE